MHRLNTPYKITKEARPAESGITILLNGRFSADSLAALENSIAEARGAHQSVSIDLSEVTLVDRKAAQYFSDQASHDIKIVNCPIYLRRWIKQEPVEE